MDEIKGFQLPQLFSRKFHCVEPRLVHEFEAPLGINALGHFLGVLDAITIGLFTVSNYSAEHRTLTAMSSRNTTARSVGKLTIKLVGSTG